MGVRVELADESPDLGSGVEVSAQGGFVLIQIRKRPAGTLVVKTAHRRVAVEHHDGSGTTVVAVPGLVLPPRARLAIRLRSSEVTTTLGHVKVVVESEPEADQARFQPLLISGMARGGTTYLQKMLGGHPGITMVNRYPFEYRHAAVLFHQLIAESSPGVGSRTLKEAQVGSHDFVGGVANPYFRPGLPVFEFLAGRHLQSRMRHTAEMVDEIYSEIFSEISAGMPQPQVVRFAEKFVPASIACAMTHIYGSIREIVLVRDPRDVAVSQLAFNDKRGFDGFGIGDATVTTVAERVAESALAHHKERVVTRPEDSFAVLRYEDLIKSPVAELDRVLSSLGMEAPPDVVARMVDRGVSDESLRDRHMTSPDMMSSVGRWREMLGDSERQRLEVTLSQFDETFGYES